MAENAFAEESQVQEAAPSAPEPSPPLQEGGYLGSVRFFKHLILTVLALSVLIPTVLSIVFGVSLRRTRAELRELRQVASQLQQTVPLEEAPSQGDEGTGLEDPQPADSPRDEGPQIELPAYQALYPDLYAPPVERSSVDEEKVVYLTFDDGPSSLTPELLEMLECYDVKATFFLAGKDSESCRQRMRDIVEAGHTVGVHSYTHDYDIIYESVEAYLDDFAKEYYLIREATGVAPQIFRFPGGSINSYNADIYQEIIGEMTRRGFVYFDWNRQTGDAVRVGISSKQLAENALERAAAMRRVFLLSHDLDGYTNVVDALPRIIEGYQAEGFSFAALTPEVKPVVFGYID